MCACTRERSSRLDLVGFGASSIRHRTSANVSAPWCLMVYLCQLPPLCTCTLRANHMRNSYATQVSSSSSKPTAHTYLARDSAHQNILRIWNLSTLQTTPLVHLSLTQVWRKTASTWTLGSRHGINLGRDWPVDAVHRFASALFYYYYYGITCHIC